nr:hypothetical protein [Desulfobulbaceae bacterium]
MKIYLSQLCVALGIIFFLLFSQKSSCGEIPEELIHKTVYGPVVDGINLKVPTELGNQQLAASGLVDITAAPFFADPTGAKDSTESIQAAIKFARDHQMVCFFPSGTYMISDTIECIQNYYKRSNSKIYNARNFPCLLIGSRQGKRPVIYLKPKSRGFENASRPKYVVHYWARSMKNHNEPAPPVSMNQMFINIDITIGKNNPGAIAIRHRGAQGSGIQESVIRVGDGLTGIEGGCGSGGSHADITVIGGNIGLDLRETQPAPTISGLTLTGQRETAILYQGRQTLSAVGVVIDFAGKGMPIVSKSASWSPVHGQVCLIDSRISLNQRGPAISSESSLYLKNVYIKNASKIIAGVREPLLDVKPGGWVHLKEYTNVAQPRK